MRLIVTGLAAALLAGCGSGLVDIDNMGGPAAAPGAGSPAAPGGQGPQAGPQGGSPGGPPGNPMTPRPGGRNTREGTIAACVADLSRSLPQGTNVPALCECSVDRMIAGTPQMDAVRQCAREQNVRLPGE